MNRNYLVRAAMVACTAACIQYASVAWASGGPPSSGKPVRTAALTTLTASSPEGILTLLPLDQSKTITAALSPATKITGTCQDCKQQQTFLDSEPTKICTTCSCGSPNVECVAWASLKADTIANLISALPLGVGLRVSFTEPGKPESGIEHLTIDRHTVLVPVVGLATYTPDQLLALLKPLSVSDPKLAAGGTELTFTVKDWWTVKQATKLGSLLTAAGAHLNYPPATPK